MTKAKFYLEEKIEAGEWTERDIGWFRVNIDERPEFAFAGDGVYE